MKIKFTFLLTLLCVFTFAQNEFITVWQPNIASSSSSGNYKIFFPGVGNNYKIYWEEIGNTSQSGTLNNITVQAGSHVTIDFGVGATADAKYIVKVSDGNGNFSSMEGSSIDLNKLLEIKQWGNIKWQSMKYAFWNAINMDVTATDVPDLSLVTDTSLMFSNCKNLIANTSFGLWDTSKVTNMESMFSGAINFN